MLYLWLHFSFEKLSKDLSDYILYKNCGNTCLVGEIDLMNEINSSDCKMATSQVFNDIIDQVQKSGLNFQLQLSPFSAAISLKKSLVKDRSGNPLMSPTPHSHIPSDIMEDLVAENKKLRIDLKSMEQKYDNTVEECSMAYSSIKLLKSDLNERDTIIRDLEASNKVAVETANRLNRKLNENRRLYEEEKQLLLKMHKNEVKAWKKDLGRANSNHLRLEKKVAHLQTTESSKPSPMHTLNESTVDLTQERVVEENAVEVAQEEMCSICGKSISSYVPDYFMGETINPACSQCKGYDTEEDPFASFPDPGMPVSLVSHWSPPYILHKHSLSSIMSLRSHYVMLPNPGDTFLSTQEVLREWKLLWEEDRKSFRNECKQS